jgi:transposase
MTMSCLPTRLRKQIVHAYNTGLVPTYDKVAEMFGVGRASVSRFLRLDRETGSVEPKPVGGNRPRAVDDEWLLNHCVEHPDALLRERVEAWALQNDRRVHLSTMGSAMARIGWTHKKRTPAARERSDASVQEKVVKFVKGQPKLLPERLVFVDETGFRLGDSPRYGWAPRGEDAIGLHVQKSWTTMTVIGAIALDGFRGVMTTNGGTSTDVMAAYVREMLTPNLKPGDVVVMDNLAAHRATRVRTLIEAAGAEVLFTPPYHPEFNPIEKTWAKLKDILRRWNTLTREAFEDALCGAMDQITLKDINGWVRHAGYQAQFNSESV